MQLAAIAQVRRAHQHLISPASFSCLTLRSVLLTRTSVHDKRCSSSLCSAFLLSSSASFPSSLTLAFPLHGTILLPCWGQSSLHCWRQVAKDTSTERLSLNVKRWERWAQRGKRGNSLSGHQAAPTARSPLSWETRNTPCFPLYVPAWREHSDTDCL